MKKKYYQYIPINQYLNYLKLVVFEIGNSRRRREGFTFVEIIMYMGILVFFLLILTQILSSVLGVRLESEAASSVHQDARFILARFIHDVNRSESIETPSVPGAQTNSLGIIINGELNTYSVSDGNLVVTNNLGSNSLNSYGTTISNLSFKRLGNTGGKNTATISLTITSTAQREKGPETETIEATAGQR